jgi:phosphoserine phosphatase
LDRTLLQMTHVLTLIANRAATTLDDALIARVRDAVRGGEVAVLSAGEAVDIPVKTAPEMAVVRAAIGQKPVDAVVVKARGRRKGLLVADMDSTIITSETLDELADFAGLKEKISAITARAMNNELNFEEALRERVGMLKGLDVGALEKTWARVKLTPGAKELVATMRAHNAMTALVSGGFTFFTARVADMVGFHVNRANVLLDDGAALLGAVAEPILGRDAKVAALQEFAAERKLKMAATLAVGDGANDLAMLAEAGLGVAFHAKPAVAATARARVDFCDLRALLFAQGYRSADIVSS